MKNSNRDGPAPNSFGDINVEALLDQSNSDYCMNQVFKDQ